jgi:alanine racemase
VAAWEWAERTGTIAYEILCGIGPRVPKVYV